jgi:hypothetical protein
MSVDAPLEPPHATTTAAVASATTDHVFTPKEAPVLMTMLSSWRSRAEARP